MRRNRKLQFNIRHRYGHKTRRVYHLSDKGILSTAYDCCIKSNCVLKKIKTDELFEYKKKIIVKGTQKEFLNFVQLFLEENDYWIEDVKF